MALEAKFDKSTLLLDSPPYYQAESGMSLNQQWRNFQSDNTRSKSFSVQFRCQNKSKAKFKNVKATLTQTIEWRVNGRTEKVQTILATSTKDASLYPELDAWWRNPLPWEEHSRNREVDRILESKPWRTMDPPLGVQATTAADSYRGGAIEVRHVLAVSLNTKGCCTTNPDASMIVNIYRNPVAFGAPAPKASATAYGYDRFRSEAESHQTVEPSAPYEDGPSAFPSSFQDQMAEATATSGTHHYNSELEVPLVQAQVLPEAGLVLPEDWNAHKAELVTIPIAEATLMDRTD